MISAKKKKNKKLWVGIIGTRKIQWRIAGALVYRF
jgi:hypothetical protein